MGEGGSKKEKKRGEGGREGGEGGGGGGGVWLRTVLLDVLVPWPFKKAPADCC